MMFERKTSAEAYAAAVKLLNRAEDEHRKNLDRLYAARETREAARITSLRRDCEKSERALIEALEAAFAVHRAYWAGRRDALTEDIRRAAIVIAEFDALAKLAGDSTQRPALCCLENLAANGHTAANLLQQEVLASDGVPQDPPDSALLEDMRGAWRAP